MIESLLAEADADGWLVNNLYQTDSGLWRCNFRRANHYTNFAEAESADDALRFALDLLDTAEYSAPAEITGSIDLSPEALSFFRQRMKQRVPTVERR